MYKRFFGAFFVSGMVLAGALVAGGCEEDVNPVIGTDAPYSIYGLFTPAFDTQWVRVFPIEGSLKLHGREKLDATVTSTDLATGEKRVWQDSLIAEKRDGRLEHAFWSPFQAAYGHAYQVEVARSDGGTSSATAAVPSRTTIEVLPAELRSWVIVPAHVKNDAGHLLKLEATYTVIYSYSAGPPVSMQSTVVKLSYDPALYADMPSESEPYEVEDGWIIPLNLTADYVRLRDYLINKKLWQPTFGMVVNAVSFDVIAASEAWAPPGGVFDPDVIGLPGLMSNVDNGFGLVVAGYRLHFGVVPSDEAAKAAGFRVFSEL